MKSHTRIQAAFLACAAGLAVLATACAGGNGTATPGTASPGAQTIECDFEPGVIKGLTPIITSSELVVGPNRFAFALEREGKLIEGAQVSVDFRACAPDASGQTLAATWRGLASEEQDHTHSAEGEEAVEPGGIYTTAVSFDHEGPWLAAFTVGEGESEPVEVLFSVQAQGNTPAIGAAAPPSETAVLAPGIDIKTIDSSNPPHPEMLELSVADAIAQKRPALVIFATPAFCISRVCGPVFEEMALLYPEYHDRLAFIHVEPYQLDAQGQPVVSNGNFVLVPAIREWGFPSEPWVVLVDGEGRVAAKFEGLTNKAEVAEAIERMLGG